MNVERSNYAFIDGQNLFLGAKQDNWAIDHKRLRIYLEKKYNVSQAYYFLGYIKVVDYLIKKGRFAKILFPNKKFASSLYRSVDIKFKATLDQLDVRKKIEYIKVEKQ